MSKHTIKYSRLDIGRQDLTRNFKLVLLALIIYVTNFFSYKHWNPTIAGWLSWFVYGAIIAYYFNIRKRMRYVVRFSTDKFLPFLIFIPLLSLITKGGYWGESLYDERAYILALSVWLLYFIFKYHNVSEKSLMNLLTVVAIFIFLVQIIQQLFPAKAVFGVYIPEKMNYVPTDIAEIRNGLYRFMIGDGLITLLMLFYWWQKLIEKISVKNLLLFLVFASSIYLLLTRQIIFGTACALVLTFAYMKEFRNKSIIVTLIIVGFLILYIKSDVLFGDLISKTRDETSEENIRDIAMLHYWTQIIGNPIGFLLGNGHPRVFHYWEKELRLFSSDIGIIGTWFHYGMLHIIVLLYLSYYVIWKKRMALPLYLKLFVLCKMTYSIYIFPYRSASEYLVWAVVLYLCGLETKQNENLILKKWCS